MDTKYSSGSYLWDAFIHEFEPCNLILIEAAPRALDRAVLKWTAMSEAEEMREFVLQQCRQQDVKFIRLWFTDILGSLKSFAITFEQLEEALEEGVSFDGGAIEGFARAGESDMTAFPDPSTLQVLPWRPRERRVARMFCDVHLPDGSPFPGDPRQVLKRNLERAAALGFTFYVGPEIEYFYFKDSEGTTPLDQGGYFDLTPLDGASDLRRETVLTLEEMGIGVESSHHEVAPSQHEVDLRYTDALTMADSVLTCRLVVKEVAMAAGVYATFMPKPLAGENGSGMHTHLSSVPRRAERLPRRQRPAAPIGCRARLHRRAATPLTRNHAGDQSVGQLLQAPDSRLRGTGARRLEPAELCDATDDARGAPGPTYAGRPATSATLPAGSRDGASR